MPDDNMNARPALDRVNLDRLSRELRVLCGESRRAIAAIDRKWSWRPSEKAMARAEYLRRIELFEWFRQELRAQCSIRGD